MNRRNFFRYLAAVPAAFVPGCFSPGLPAANVEPIYCFVPTKADVDDLIQMHGDAPIEAHDPPWNTQLTNGDMDRQFREWNK